MIKKWALFVCFFQLALAAAAQINLTASTDKTALTLDDEVTLTVRVTGATGNFVMPQLPSLPAFNVYSREVDQTTVNGRSTFVFRYTLLPRFVGQATIGPVTFNYQGTAYKTEPIALRIYRSGSAQTTAPAALPQTASAPAADTPRPSSAALPPLEAALTAQASSHGQEPFFLVSAVSNRTPYVNQEITLAVRFYYSRSFYDAPYQKPSVSNIFLEEAGSSEGTQTVGGVPFRYQEQRYTLMAAAPGKATIGSATVQYQTGSSPLSALDRLFGASALSAPKTARSLPITLEVRPLPPGQPASFYGAVGEGYTLSAQAQPHEVQAGEAVNVTVTVKGPGNLKSTGDLTFTPVDGFKSYPAAPESGRTAPAKGVARNYKTFKTVLVPAASGIYELPAVEWSYFNPQTGQYNTLSTQPITLTVTPATKTESSFDFASASPAGNGVHTLTQDIAYLKTAYAPQTPWLAQLGVWKWVHALALLAVAVCLLFASVGRKSLARKKAFATAKAELKAASSLPAVAQAVAVYLQEKLQINTGSLPLKLIHQALRQKGVTAQTAQAFSRLWQRLDAARFAPGELGAQSALELATQALDVLRSIEEETK